jgi:hypothetical protein
MTVILTLKNPIGEPKVGLQGYLTTEKHEDEGDEVK